MAETPNTFALMLRLGVSLGLVLALVGAVTWVLRRRGLLRSGGVAAPTERLELLDRKSLGRRASLVVARMGDVSVLLGVTDQQVNVLAHVGRPEGATLDTTASPTPVTSSPMADLPELERAPEPAADMTTGSRRTGTRVDAHAPATQTRMSFVDALRELTVRTP